MTETHFSAVSILLLGPPTPHDLDLVHMFTGIISSTGSQKNLVHNNCI